MSWYTTENLFRELDDPDVSLLAMRCMDYVNGWRKGIYPWSASCRLNRERPRLWTRDLVLPPGWMKRFPNLGMRPIAQTVRRFWKLGGDAAARAGDDVSALPVISPNQLEPEVSLYYNLDDYALVLAEPGRRDSRPGAAAGRERRTPRSAFRSFAPRSFGGRCPRRPVGFTTSRTARLARSWPIVRWIARAAPPADLGHLPRPLLGYVGTLEDRLDWELLDRLSLEFPSASIVIVGRPPGGQPVVVVRAVRSVSGASQRPRGRLAAAGRVAGLLPGVRPRS